MAWDSALLPRLVGAGFPASGPRRFGSLLLLPFSVSTGNPGPPDPEALPAGVRPRGPHGSAWVPCAGQEVAADQAKVLAGHPRSPVGERGPKTTSVVSVI